MNNTLFQNIKADTENYKKKIQSKNPLKIFFLLLFSDGFEAVINYRFCRWMRVHHIPTLPDLFTLITRKLTRILLPPNANIGKGLYIGHFGFVVLHENTIIDNNCTIMQGVTIGNRNDLIKAPKIKNNVYIGANAVILGDITIGNNAKIGANTVVVKNVSANTTVVGQPSKIIVNK